MVYDGTVILKRFCVHGTCKYYNFKYSASSKYEKAEEPETHQLYS